MSLAPLTKPVVLGVVGRPHGLRGLVHVRAVNPDTELLAPGANVWLVPKRGEARGVTLSSVREGSEMWVVGLEGVGSREQAEVLTGAELVVDRSALPPLGPDEFYHVDAVGLAVVDELGAPRGTVREVLTYPSCDALVIEQGESTVELALVPGVVLEVDVPGGRVVVSGAALTDG